jgi:hypothetical protein
MTKSELPHDLPPRLRRILQLVYGVEGVVSAQVWQWSESERIAVGVRGAAAGYSSMLREVELAVAGLREPGETWEFGVLESTPDAIARS